MRIDGSEPPGSGGGPPAGAQPLAPAVPIAGSALPPEEIARAAEAAGVKKAHLDAATLFGLAVLGGAFIGLGGMFSTVVMSGAEGHLSFGVTKLLGGLTFALGFMLVVVAGAQLFTSDCLMVMAWANGRLRLTEMLRVWSVVWLGNLVGAVATATLVYLSGQFRFGHGAVGDTALHIASAKSTLPVINAFFLGVLCNVLVCLAAWLAMGARSVGDKILAILFPVAAFVAGGFEHCVANMYFLPLGLMIEAGAPAEFRAELAAPGQGIPAIPVPGVLANLAMVTAGNWLGGTLLVGGVYWFLFLRRERRAAAGGEG